MATKRAYSTVAAQANSIAVRASGTGAPFEKFAIVQLSPTPGIKFEYRKRKYVINKES